MSEKNPRIVFMGTPEIAAYVLKELVVNNYNIAAVVTAPDRPAGRGRKLCISEVKKTAIEYDIKVLQPENLNDTNFINELKDISPDIQIVVAFRKLPKEVWQTPHLCTFNLHASYLPDYRGAAPINWVIINGEKQTGVTTFIIDDKIDTGKILLREKIDIEPYETAGTLHDKIKAKGARLVIKTLEGILDKSLTPIDQKSIENEFDNLNKAPKIFKEDCCIDWSRAGDEIANLIRGLNPVPGAFTEITIKENKTVCIKIFEAIPEKFDHTYPVKTILTDNKTYLKITTPDGAIKIKKLQLPGKKPCKVEEFLRGYNISE